jgi:hypothetical protein
LEYKEKGSASVRPGDNGDKNHVFPTSILKRMALTASGEY